MSSFERIQQTFADALDKITTGSRAMLSSTQEKFDNGKPKNNIFNYLNSIGNEDLFFYLVIVVMSVLISHNMGVSFTVFIGLIIGVIIVYYLREREIALGDNFEMEHETKLEHNIFENTNNMHMDASLIDLLYSIKEYKQYNPDVFIRIARNIDNLLRIEKDLENGAQYPHHMFDIAHDLQKKTLNALHSMVHSIPHSKLSDEKHTKALDAFNISLSSHMNRIRRLVKKNEEGKSITTESRPFNKHHDSVNPSDTSYNGHYEFFC